MKNTSYLEDKVEELANNVEKMKIADYVNLLQNPYKLLYLNFLGGLARGVGIAVGVTILGALLIYFLRWLVVLNLPVIGDFIADLVRIVQFQLGNY